MQLIIELRISEECDRVEHLLRRLVHLHRSLLLLSDRGDEETEPFEHGQALFHLMSTISETIRQCKKALDDFNADSLSLIAFKQALDVSFNDLRLLDRIKTDCKLRGIL